jgi:hypothetical protein
MEKTTTTQLTSKQLKAQILISGLVFFLGMLLAFGSDDPRIGIAMAVVGFFWQIVARVLIWWHHG